MRDRDEHGATLGAEDENGTRIEMGIKKKLKFLCCFRGRRFCTRRCSQFSS